MKDIIYNFLKSFDNSEGGFSARKLTAFGLMVLITYTHYKYVDLSNAIEAILIDLAGVLIALGIITMEQVIKFKNGDKNE
jgi:hypothetical protein